MNVALGQRVSAHHRGRYETPGLGDWQRGPRGLISGDQKKMQGRPPPGMGVTQLAQDHGSPPKITLDSHELEPGSPFSVLPPQAGGEGGDGS